MSDFGIKTSYPAQMKAVASSMTDAQLIDITHNITAHNIREGAFVLKTSAIHFPAGTVHVAVVDPGVGTDRKGLVIVTRSQILVGPDNGLLLPAARALGDFNVYEITNQNLMRNPLSSTFHGRDIFTPVAANIVNGLSFEHIGPVIKDYVDLNFDTATISDKTATGKIIYIDDFGNIITNINSYDISRLLDNGKKIMVFIGNKNHEMPYVKTYNIVEKGKLLATMGSNNYLEISMNQGNAAEKLKVKPDDEIKILFN
jgi:S-adenosylmethionine hydrolase